MINSRGTYDFRALGFPKYLRSPGGGWGGAPCHQERGALCEMQPGLELPEELVTGGSLGSLKNLCTCLCVSLVHHFLPRHFTTSLVTPEYPKKYSMHLVVPLHQSVLIPLT